MADAEDEFDALPDIYSGMDFSSIPWLSGTVEREDSPTIQQVDLDLHAYAGVNADTYPSQESVLDTEASDDGVTTTSFSFDELDEAALTQLDAIETAFRFEFHGKYYSHYCKNALAETHRGIDASPLIIRASQPCSLSHPSRQH